MFAWTTQPDHILAGSFLGTPRSAAALGGESSLGILVTPAAGQEQWLMSALSRAALKSSKKRSSERNSSGHDMSEDFLGRNVTCQVV